MRNSRHGLGSTSNYYICIASDDSLSAENDCFETRGADFVDSCADGGIAQSSSYGALAGRSLTKAENNENLSSREFSNCDLLGRQDISEENFLNIFGLDFWHTFKGTLMDFLANAKENLKHSMETYP